MTATQETTSRRSAAHPKRSNRHEVADRVRRLSTVSANRMIDPDDAVPGHVGPGQILPDELLSIAGLNLDLTPEQRATLSREEVGSIVTAGIVFEAVLIAGLALEVTRSRDLTDPRITYILHEIGEETRHQRLFIRMLQDIRPQSPKPLDRAVVRAIERFAMAVFVQRPAMLYTLILGGEEIPDLLQKKAAEHPDTDSFVREVNRYHRQEEARHLSFARSVLPEVWAEASFFDRFLVKRIAPRIIRQMFDMLIQPGVYKSVDLPTWATWKAANRTPTRTALRHEATRPVLQSLIAAGALRPGKINKLWGSLCGVDRDGREV